MTEQDVQRYSKGAILLHWLLAFALAVEIAIGFTMPPDVSGFALYQLHKSIGIAILLLTLLRLGWRLTHRTPAPLESGFTGFLASAVHVLFYVFLVLAPLTGWAIVSTAPIDVPTMLFGVVPWPHLPLADSLNSTFETVHEWLAFIALALFALHVAGALRHHFLIRDGLLGRMAPGGRAAFGLGLGVAVIALGAALFLILGAKYGGDRPAAGDGETAGFPAGPPAGSEEAPAMEPADTDEAASGDEIAENEQEEAAEPAEAEPASEPAGPPPQWTIQPGGSLRFAAENAGMALNGSFADWSGRIAFDPANPESADIAITVRLASATLGDGSQDGMLRGANFLAASSSPTATWRSTDVTRIGDNRYRATGTLSLRGASRPQAVTFTLSGSGNRRSVAGNATIDRNAFGVGTGEAAADLAGNVALSFDFDAVR